MEFLKVIAPILAAGIAYLLGQRTYLKQKEYELVRKRYLDEGVDQVASELERILNVNSRNWAHSLAILKIYRDLGPQHVSDELLTSLIEAEVIFNINAQYKIQKLVQSDIFWLTSQLVISFVNEAYTTYRDEIAKTIILDKTPGKLNIPHTQVVDKMTKILEDLDSRSYVYTKILHHLENLATVLEQERFGFEQIKKFHEKQSVIAIVDALKADFKPLLHGTET